MKETLKIIKSKLIEQGPIKFVYYIFLFIFEALWVNFYIKKTKKIESFSQKFEDYIISYFLNFKKKGFYVDIGANNPDIISNTKKFYLEGWMGINIEPNFFEYQKYQKKRSRDINLNIALSNTAQTMYFYMFEANTLSTFSKKQALIYKKNGHKMIKKIRIKTHTLRQILNKYLNLKKIDFLSIDTEGFDLAILKSNDWKKYRPTVICVEANSKFGDNSELKKYLNNHGYSNVIDIVHYGNILNSIYVENNYLKKTKLTIKKIKKNLWFLKYCLKFYIILH